MKTGIELISEERQRQITEKGYDAAFVEANPAFYEADQLVHAAIFTLSKDDFYAPNNWPSEDLARLEARKDIEALKVAGAFCAAEIDRLQSLKP